MAQTGKPVILSSGLSDWNELDAAVNCVRENGSKVAVLQCATAYPCPPEKLGLNVIAELRQRYRCHAGLSDHSGTIYAGLAAAALGAKMIEIHVAFSRECFGPDVIASITTPELKQLVEGVRFIERALPHPVDKSAITVELSELRKVFGKSVVAARDLNAGDLIAAEDIAFKKPGTGIPAARFNDVINRRLKRAVAADTAISEDDLD
jgi:N-acetylneuraminate synthase